MEQLFKFGVKYNKYDIRGYDLVSDPGFAFPLVQRVFIRMLASEIVSVQPVGAPMGRLLYFDFIIENKNKFTFGRIWKP